MGKSIFNILFSGSDDQDREIKVREKNEDKSVTRADRYTDTGGGKHVHEGYNLDKATGNYKEYRGGENSNDRGYNKDSGSSGDKSSGKGK